MGDDILLVEDDPGSQELIRALCAARGYAVDVAGDGFLGLRLLSERRHGIALIDYHLPEMDGFALARLMREIVGAKARLKLVGITADRHGLASRRGADALFDAILVKPLDPALLYATLDRLTGPEGSAPAVEPAAAGHAADTLWRRRGLSGRPRAVLCPDPGPEVAAAVGEAFELGSAETADLILIAAPEGLDGLRALRTAGPGRFLPAIDLDGRLRGVCDGAFRVDDAEAWNRLAELCRTFAARRASIPAAIRESDDPATRLLTFLHVGDRALSLTACADPSAMMAEMGLSRAATMSAVLRLAETGLAVCGASPDGVSVRLTEAGIRAATGAARAAPDPDPRAALERQPSPIPDPAPRTGLDAAPDRSPDDPIVDHRRVDALRDLIGEAELARLRDDLLTRLGQAFPREAPRTSIAHEAHALIAAAGNLGFARLSTACRDLQTAVSQGRDEAEALLRARGAVQEVLDAVAAVGSRPRAPVRARQPGHHSAA
ncbi:response regulator [Methylobacterium sp. NEAU 140]|uniref:response regulator n=1 Tax=Methylobacterium sp. NEAU 140 TaxID=3064945 RepID=UPI0027356F65|nr:response regulator [Methylobacterium sp. NEAU 140]MDP4023021.1 response regulator [Methylobacterium sp. NEAU 140]